MTTRAFSAAELSFDPILHEYRLPDGEAVPSVTTILGAVGVSVNFENLSQLSERNRANIDFKRDLGHALHADAHAYDDDDLVWETVNSEVLPYLLAWATFRTNTGLVPVSRERRVFHPTLFYCGTLDGIFRKPDGRLVLVDIKTGDPEDSGCRWQTAAYLAAFLLEHPELQVVERWGVRLMPDKVVPYDIDPYSDWREWLQFQSFLTTYHCQAARRGRRS